MSFLDANLYDNFNDSWSEEFDALMFGLDNFSSAIKNVLDDYTPVELEPNGPSRLASPPYEAYKYVGHNELEISQSKNSYALLFEA